MRRVSLRTEKDLFKRVTRAARDQDLTECATFLLPEPWRYATSSPVHDEVNNCFNSDFILDLCCKEERSLQSERRPYSGMSHFPTKGVLNV